jgi:AraC-like DNA-binding protein
MTKPNISREYLKNAIAQNRTLESIAKDFGVSRWTIKRRLDNYQIPFKRFKYTVTIDARTYTILQSKGDDWVREQLVMLANCNTKS